MLLSIPIFSILLIILILYACKDIAIIANIINDKLNELVNKLTIDKPFLNKYKTQLILRCRVLSDFLLFMLNLFFRHRQKLFLEKEIYILTKKP